MAITEIGEEARVFFGVSRCTLVVVIGHIADYLQAAPSSSGSVPIDVRAACEFWVWTRSLYGADASLIRMASGRSTP
jgi:hypothetical protein